MDGLAALKDWLVGGALVVTSALTLWNFFQSPAKKNADDLTKFREGEFSTFKTTTAGEIKLLDTEIDDTKARVSTLETTVQQMPDKDAVHRLELQLEKLNTKIAGMAASAEATKQTATRVEKFLLEHGKNGTVAS